MNAKLKYSLDDNIQEWMHENCESDEWLDTNHFVHDSLKLEMTNAAEAVFDAIVNYQKWAKVNL